LLSTLAAVVLSALASYLNFLFANLMEHVQLIFSIFGAPFWAIFLLGMGTRRTTEKGAIAGLLSGTALAIFHLVAVTRHWIHYGSLMNANFHGAIYAFTTTFAIGWLASLLVAQSVTPSSPALVFDWQVGKLQPGTRLIWTLSILLLLMCGAMNLFWR
jgi:SSS family solute:Na+ symporter